MSTNAFDFCRLVIKCLQLMLFGTLITLKLLIPHTCSSKHLKMEAMFNVVVFNLLCSRIGIEFCCRWFLYSVWLLCYRCTHHGPNPSFSGLLCLMNSSLSRSSAASPYLPKLDPTYFTVQFHLPVRLLVQSHPLENLFKSL